MLLYSQVNAQTVMSDSRVGKMLKKGESRYATTGGALCVITFGMKMMLTWSVGNSGSLQ